MPLDIYEVDMMPRAQKVYLMRYGWHFNKQAYLYASDLMRKRNKQTEKLEKVPRYTKDEVDALLQRNNVQVEHKGGYDYIYAAQMCRAILLGSSVPDEQHLALYVKDTCDDVGGGDGVVMRKWYASMVGSGEPVEWEDLLENE